MKLSEKTGILKIYVGESDKVHHRPLYEEIIYEARNSGIAGATAFKGIMSFGASHSIHTLKIFALSTDMPVVIEIVDNMEVLHEFANKVNLLMDQSKKGGLVTFQEIDVIRYEKGEKYKMFNKPQHD
jgi:PII-like signaling protein